ncbi:hypothetical protein [Arenicella xantha]|uniref:Uncharacterized protein n=1 Tax=Arenicella xantha TaxID=644221 RepID=A0A395JN82_9GAMM|nr:hypothetical protein [Arenicella xantha]RBP53111.1 hypothetical protein DFR28_101496 [Arenicella xantha]
MHIIKPGQKHNFSQGSPELAVTNIGSGSTTYTIKIGEHKTKKKTLNGAGAMETYENVRYPVEIDNLGPDKIQVS